MQSMSLDSTTMDRIANMAQAVILWLDRTSGAAWCSETAVALLGHAPQRLADSWAGDLDLVVPQDRETIARALAQAGPEEVLVSLRLVRGDACQAELEAAISLAQAQGSGPGAVMVLLRDVSAQSARRHEQAVFAELSREARFTNCRRTNTVRFDDGLQRVFGIGLSGTHVVPTRYVDHIHPEDRDLAYHGYYRLIEQTHGQGEMEFRLRRGDGTYAMVRERFLVERDPSGSILAVHSTVTDISDWHQERMRRDLLAKASGRVVIDYDPHKDQLRFSGATEERLGHAHDAMPVRVEDYLAMVHPDDRPRLRDSIDDLSSGRERQTPQELSYRLRRADGTYAPFLDRSLRLLDADGQTAGVVVVLTDVSTVLQSQEELRISHERLRALADLSGQVVAELDIATGLITWSGEVQAQFGHAPEEMPKDPGTVMDMLHPDDRAAHEAAFQRLNAGDAWTTPLELSFRTRHRDGRLVHILNRSICVLDKNGKAESILAFLSDVTSLLQKQDQLLAMSEIASDANYEYFHDEGRIVYNQGFRTCFGHDWVGEHGFPSPWKAFVHPDDLDRVRDDFLEFVDSTLPRFVCEYRFRRGDGSWAIVTEKVAALRDAEGRATVIIGSLDDVTEGRRATARLREAVEALDSGFALYDESQRLVLHNRRFVELNTGIADLIRPGVQRDSLLAAMASRKLLLSPEKATYSQGSQGRRPVNTDITQADGRLYNVRFNQTESGDWVSLITDVTAVVQDQKKLRAMFEVSADAMFEFDIVRGLVSFDSGFRTHFGYDWSGEYPEPSPWQQTVHPDDRISLTERFREFLAGRQNLFVAEFRMRRADGSWAHVAERAVALRDEKGKAVLVIGAIADQTEQRMLEEKLHAAQKMEAIGRISGGIAHDFNNLLAVIMGNAELMAALSKEASVHDLADEIVAAAQRGAELTRRLLSFARRSRLEPEAVNANDLVTGMGQLIGRVLPATISVQTSLQAGLWMTRVDPAFLESALLNLVINARDAMPSGGTLTIETCNLRVNEDYGLERGEVIAPGRYIMLAVTDTGHGIPREIVARVVEPFFSTKGPQLGSGLGLSMVDGFVRQSGGALRIYSEPDIGTTIKILLPAAPADAGTTTRAAALPWRDPSPGQLRVLLVEDEPKVRAVVARMLEEFGLEVVQAGSGDSALALYQQIQPPPEILLTDVVMPGTLQGPLLARALRELKPDLVIIFMSGYANEAAINGNGLRPDDIFLMKPIQRTALLDAITRFSPGATKS